MERAFFRYPIIAFFLISLLYNCKSDPGEPGLEEGEETASQFTLLPPDSSQVYFQNKLVEGPNANVLMYEYLYNGGGVATADLNGDGLLDLYFTSNMGDNTCYLNMGDMKFKDITRAAGLSGRAGPWKTGISAADVNGDGLLDLYLCYSGALPPEKRSNQLFINQGNDSDGIPVFKEMAAEYGLASQAYSNQGYFFDYDRDGDLDMLLLNHNPKSLPILNVAGTRELLKKDDPLQGVRLYRQDEGRFTDVTVASGISGSPLTYGLGLGIADLNDDGWADFYISNDYAVPDYMYINLQNGRFENQLNIQLGHTSHFSMGNDIADVNNDGLPDIFTLDMLPEDNRRQKLLLSPDNYDKFDLNVRSGFHYQYMRNMLQLNNGQGSFSEIGQLSGISNTDWSWAALLADYNNDGWKDLFVTNGYFRDYTNLDFINYMEDFVQSKGRLVRQDVLELVGQMPSSNLTNYFFTNQQDGTFSNDTARLGLGQPANSNGAAYADLDNDGDLELIVNNINKPAFIYRNDIDPTTNHYLKVELKGNAGNTQGIGSRVTIYMQGDQQSLYQMPTRGYLSTVSPVLHFGLGQASGIDSLHVQWNSGAGQTLTQIEPNQVLVLEEKEAAAFPKSRAPESAPYLVEEPSTIDFKSNRSAINDFKRQSLLISQFSHDAPCMARGDLNNDGRMDVFVGGSAGQEAGIYLQQANGEFRRQASRLLADDRASHDGAVAIFDANRDGNMDVYVASGGYHDFEPGDIRLQDRLYLGNGNGTLSASGSGLPQIRTSSSSVAVSDVNNDGFPDIFVGGRVVPGRYPETPQSYLLINDGKGSFKDATKELAPELQFSGMVTDALWTDLNSDGQEDLVLAGEWMPLAFYINNSGRLQDETHSYLDQSYYGWWNTIATADFNGDGRLDFVLGNVGRNTQFRVNDEEPAQLLYADFDRNGSIDPIFNFHIGGKSYPYLTRDELLGQLAYLRSKFTTYASYADATLEDIFSAEELRSAKELTANHMTTSLFLSRKEGGFALAPLPIEAQFSTVHQILVADVNKDGNEDLLLFGNNEFFKLRLGRFDANYGTLLLGRGDGSFEYVPQTKSGLEVKGDVRSALHIGDKIYLGLYGQNVKTYKLQSH